MNATPVMQYMGGYYRFFRSVSVYSEMSWLNTQPQKQTAAGLRRRLFTNQY
jgi:hypothetical protein